MSDLARLLPEGFAQGYWDAFRALPPTDFLEAYEFLCDVLYWGSGEAPEPGDEGRRGKRFHTGYTFGDPRVLGLKVGVDKRIAAIRTSLRTWTASRASPRSGRPRPAPDGRADLAGAHRTRDRDATPHREEEVDEGPGNRAAH